LISGLTARGVSGVAVRAVFQPSTVGLPQGPQVTIQAISDVRYGALRRFDAPESDPLKHIEMQWWETTLQIGATARLRPEQTSVPGTRTAMDICKIASDILQSD